MKRRPRHPVPKGKMRDAFEQIATGNESPIMADPTRDALLRNMHIRELPPKRVGVGPLSVMVRCFEVPINVHAAWCEWCAANVDDPV